MAEGTRCDAESINSSSLYLPEPKLPPEEPAIEKTGPGSPARGGFPLAILVVENKKYSCAICQLLFREPVQSQCGHRQHTAGFVELEKMERTMQDQERQLESMRVDHVELSARYAVLEKTVEIMKKIQQSTLALPSASTILRLPGVSDAIQNGNNRVPLGNITTNPQGEGYTLGVFLFPNGTGSGEGTHASVGIAVMTSDVDAVLPWPLQGRISLEVPGSDVTAEIIPNRVMDGGRWERPQGLMNDLYVIEQFCPLNLLFDLEDEILFLRVCFYPG